MNPPQKQHETAGRKMLISGCVAFMFELCGGHSIQFLKVQRQTTGKPYAVLFREITRHKGLIGLLDGFLPWGAAIAIGKGAMFGWGHAVSKQHLTDHMTVPVAEVMAGGIGGFVQGISASPILLLNTRVMTNSEFRQSSNLLQSTKASCYVLSDVIRNEGPLALMKGAHILAGKRVMDWSSRFFFVGVTEAAMLRYKDSKELSFRERGIASLTGGMISCFVTLPLDVMVATVQQNSKAKHKVPLFRTIRDIFNSRGLLGTAKFYTRGMASRATHVALVTFLMKTFTSFVYEKTAKDGQSALPSHISLPTTSSPSSSVLISAS